LSKVLLVRLCVIQFTRYSVQLSAFAVSLFNLAHPKSFVKNFFQVFSFFFFICALRSAFARALGYITTSPSICQALFSTFLKNFGGPFGPPIYRYFTITECRQSDHSHRRFSCKPRQRYLRYPHPGRQRSYAPTGSSASRLLHGSWV